MKIVLMMIIAFNFINANTEVQISQQELSKHFVQGFETINNKLFIVSYGGQGKAYLDAYNLDNHTIQRNLLDQSDVEITFGNANLFKDSKRNLWIGDVNSLIKLDETGFITNLFKDIDLPDSNYFEVRSMTEDNNGNYYFLKRNSKIMVDGEENGTKYSWVESELELIKYDGSSFKVLKTIEGIGASKEKIYFFKNKIYFTSVILGKNNTVLSIFDLNTNSYEKVEIENIDYTQLESLSWEISKEVQITEIFEFNKKLYFSISVNASLSYFKTFVNFDINSKKMKFISPDRNVEQDMVHGITSFTIFNDRIFCSGYTLNGENRTFFEFKDDKFVPYLIKNKLNPKIVTSSHIYNELNQRKIYFEHVDYAFKNDMHIDSRGNLYAGTNKGLIFIENFIQQPSNVKKYEISTKTVPGLSKVKNELYIESEFNINSYKVFDINSKVLQTQSNLNSNNINLNLEGLTIGIYFIELNTLKGKKILTFIKI